MVLRSILLCYRTFHSISQGCLILVLTQVPDLLLGVTTAPLLQSNSSDVSELGANMKFSAVCGVTNATKHSTGLAAWKDQQPQIQEGQVWSLPFPRQMLALCFQAHSGGKELSAEGTSFISTFK